MRLIVSLCGVRGRGLDISGNDVRVSVSGRIVEVKMRIGLVRMMVDEGEDGCKSDTSNLVPLHVYARCVY